MPPRPTETSLAVSPPGILEVDLGALVANYQDMARRAPGSSVGAAVKANAYGLGVGPVVRALSDAGCKRFFVATLQEGIELRALLRSAEVCILNGLLPGDEPAMLQHRLIPVLNDIEQVERWRSGGQGAPCIVHVDTGMNRLGIAPEEAGALASSLQGLNLIELMSHLACAGQQGHPQNAAQLALFNEITPLYPFTPKSLANSAGVLLGPDYHFDAVRVGIALYGGNPAHGIANPFRAVVTLKAQVLQQRWITPPATVGYEALYTVDRRMRLATVAAGYADGLPTTLTNKGHGFVDGHAVPIVGRISMDLITLDVTAAPEEATAPGAYIEIIGPNARLDDLADAGGLISYELLTGLGPRFERRYL
ncbi:MAG: alanine racemase [Alphaproteobacteria bacterium]